MKIAVIKILTKSSMKKAGTMRSGAKVIGSIKTKPAYNAKIAESKKKDLQSLLTSNIIPKYYKYTLF